MIENRTISKAEVVKLRAETKGTLKKIHFNNAGCSLPPDIVVGTVTRYLEEEALEGGYEIEARYKQELQNVYTLIAKMINADPEEIAILENASQAWSTAFRGISFKKGDVILTSEYEYTSNIIGLLDAKKYDGVEIKIVPNDEEGNFSLSALEELITAQTKLIAVTHIPSGAGGILPIAEIGKIANKHNIIYLVDACQSIGQVPVDVKEIGCHMLSVTGRKFLRAPRGTGFLFVKKGVQNDIRPLFIDGDSIVSMDENDYILRQDARRYEMFESNKGLRLGLGRAAEYALDIGVERIWLRIQLLASMLRERLQNIAGVALPDLGREKSGIITFSVKGVSSAHIRAELATRNINVSVTTSISTPYYMQKHGLDNLVRASIHYYNSEEEIDIFCREVVAIIN